MISAAAKNRGQIPIPSLVRYAEKKLRGDNPFSASHFLHLRDFHTTSSRPDFYSFEIHASECARICCLINACHSHNLLFSVTPFYKTFDFSSAPISTFRSTAVLRLHERSKGRRGAVTPAYYPPLTATLPAVNVEALNS